jgi:hypothetical protein
MDDKTKDKLGIPRHMKAEMWIMDFDMTENEIQACKDKQEEEREIKRQEDEFNRIQGDYDDNK